MDSADAGAPLQLFFFRTGSSSLNGIWKSSASSESPAARMLVAVPNLRDFMSILDCALFFEHIPTRSQYDAVVRFAACQCNEAEPLPTELASGDPTLQLLGGSMLVHAETGGGGTAVLAALALYSALVRGRRALILVPDASSENEILARLNRVLSRLRIHPYVDARSLDRLVPGELDRLPHILVGTPESFEKRLYDSPAQAGDARTIRKIATLIEVLLIDDFTRFAPHVRLHLPFLIARQRLIMAAENQSLHAAA